MALILFFVFVVPDVNLTLFKAGATSNSSINVSWKIQHINKRLNEPTRYRLSYCPKKYCENYSFVENHNAETSADLENLITYVKYKIRVKAVGITAKDGTKVLIPSGNFSEPIYERTLEGGKRWSLYLILLRVVSKFKIPFFITVKCQLHKTCISPLLLFLMALKGLAIYEKLKLLAVLTALQISVL